MFFMRENGAKQMNLFVGTVNLSDFRLKSKLKNNKRILFSMKKDQKGYESDTGDEVICQDDESVKSLFLDECDFKEEEK